MNLTCIILPLFVQQNNTANACTLRNHTTTSETSVFTKHLNARKVTVFAGVLVDLDVAAYYGSLRQSSISLYIIKKSHHKKRPTIEASRV